MRPSAPGLAFRGYCHGITVGDIDNDGDPDVFLSNYGGDALYVNNGNGTFTEIGQAAGIFRPDTWSSSAAFLDYDGDGDLDLYVSRYGDWQYPRDDQFCGDPKRQIRRYCPPQDAHAGQAYSFPEQRRPDFHGRDRQGRSRPGRRARLRGRRGRS